MVGWSVGRGSAGPASTRLSYATGTIGPIPAVVPHQEGARIDGRLVPGRFLRAADLDGTLGETNSVAFQFSRVGVVSYPAQVAKPEEMFEAALEAGATDVESGPDGHEVICAPEGRRTQDLLLEGGVAWLPGILWRLDTNWRALRGEVPWLDRRPSEVAREHVRFTTQPLEHTDGRDDLLFEMLEAVGAPETLLFASDYPHWDFDDPAFMLRRLPEAWRAPVLHDNAAALYGARLGLAAA